jgi:hypothetical protein
MFLSVLLAYELRTQISTMFEYSLKTYCLRDMHPYHIFKGFSVYCMHVQTLLGLLHKNFLKLVKKV